MVKRLRLRPLTPTTRVRFPHESPKCVKGKKLNIYKLIVGVDDAEGPPVPIPNTEVKLSSAENTWLATAREDRTMPTQAGRSDRRKYSSIAQSVEHAAVNRRVVGSSPTIGAKQLVLIAARVHPFPYRTRKLSSHGAYDTWREAARENK